MNGQLKPGTSPLSYACWIGNQPALSPRKYTPSNAVKKAGNALRAIMPGTTNVSSAPPRRQAAIIPIAVPNTNASRNAIPTSTIEYGQHASDDLGDGCRVVRGRDAEVEVAEPVQVGDVVVPDRPFAAAEQRLVGLDDSRVRLDLSGREALQDTADRVARHQARQQEVQRQGDPDGERRRRRICEGASASEKGPDE